MKQITSIGELEVAIAELKIEQEIKGKLLREEFNNVTESLKPINLLKDTFRQGTSSLNLFEGILGSIVGVAAGALSRNIFVGASSSIARKLLGSAFQFGVANIVGRNARRIGIFGKSIAQRIFKRKSSNSDEV